MDIQIKPIVTTMRASANSATLKADLSAAVVTLSRKRT